ncbi:MAG TPA: hypothetical protein VMR31_10300 [Myxococcota bacterium]|nr:hypothetical protein [Myxococcota bacterium]
MRIHGIHLRGLSAPAGDHPLGLDPGYTVVCLPDAAEARRFLELIEALLYPSSDDVASRDTRGRAVLSLALRSDAYVIAADFARGRISLGRQDAKDGGYQALSSDPREIEDYGLAVGLPQPGDFRRLHVCGLGAARGDDLLPARRPAPEPVPQPAPARAAARSGTAEREDRGRERARLLAEHEQQVLALAHERAKREGALERALAAARAGRVRSEERIHELRSLEAELAQLERQHKSTLVELEKNAALGDVVEDFDARVAHFRALMGSRDSERAAIDETRAEVLAERARLRSAPRRQLAPIALGLTLGVAGAAAGAVGYPVGYGLAALGLLALLGALALARAARSQLARSEALLAALRVRERGSERRFETEGAQVRGLLVSLGLDSIDALAAAATRYGELAEKAELEKRRLAELVLRYPSGAREELAALERDRGQSDAIAAVRAARDALLALPAEIALPALPPEPAPAPPELELAPAEAKPDEDDTDTPREPLPEPAPAPAPAAQAELSPSLWVEAAARVVGRSDTDVRARLAPALSVYLRALTAGTFTSARRVDDGDWVLRGAARDEQPFRALPDREQALVCLAFQLALHEALASERRVPLFVGPELPVRGDAEARAFGRALKRLSAVVQVVQACGGDGPFGEHAAKSLSL